jgi:hypothetical protein
MPTQFSQFINGGNLQAGDRIAGLRNNLNTLFIPDTTSTLEINQVGHGFLVGQLLEVNGPGTFGLASAFSPLLSNVIGIVIQVIDANNFVLQYIGLTPPITPQINPPIAAFIPGNVYYLSDVVAGSYTAVAPVIPGHVLKPVLIAFTTTTAFILNYQGNVL